MAMTTSKYNKFCHLSVTMLFSCLGFTQNMISPKSPLKFRSTCLSFGILACRYAPLTPKAPMYLPSYFPMTIVVNRTYKDTVGDDIIYPPFKYFSVECHQHMSLQGKFQSFVDPRLMIPTGKRKTRGCLPIEQKEREHCETNKQC